MWSHPIAYCLDRKVKKARREERRRLCGATFMWDLPNPGIEPGSPALQADALPSEPPGKPVYALTAVILSQRNPKETEEADGEGSDDIGF